MSGHRINTLKILGILAVFLGVFSAAACGTVGVGTGAVQRPAVTVGSPTPSAASNVPTKAVPTASPSPTPNPSLAVSVHVFEDALPGVSPGFVARGSDLVVAGHVTRILPPQWGTPDGKPPADLSSAVADNSYNGIITPVIITSDGPQVVDRLGATSAGGTIVVAQLGGTIGQHSVTYSGTPIILPNEHVLVVLNRISDPNGTLRLIQTDVGPAWGVAMKYPITADGNAVVNGTPVSETDVIARMKAADSIQATPTPKQRRQSLNSFKD
jgi:hypothetical protein